MALEEPSTSMAVSGLRVCLNTINNSLLMMHYSMIAKIQALLDVTLQCQIRQIVFKHTV